MDYIKKQDNFIYIICCNTGIFHIQIQDKKNRLIL